MPSTQRRRGIPNHLVPVVDRPVEIELLAKLDLPLFEDGLGRQDEDHSDRGTQYLSMRYTDRLAAAGIAPSVGSQGDAFDNALAESVIGLYKTEVIRRRGPWRTLEAVEFATLEWVDWFNMRRLLGPIGDVPPAEFEAQYYEQAKVA